MAQTITNQASLNFRYNGQSGVAVSNIATAILTDPLTIAKNSIEETYRVGDELTFVVSFVNSGTSALNSVTVNDDLGTFDLGAIEITPLTFVPPALLYVNGVYAGTITAAVESDGITFTIPSLPAEANALIIYKAVVNDTAPRAVDAEITNTVTIDAEGISGSISTSNTVTAAEYANVTITKSMSPAVIVDGSMITYTFTINNYGNTPATNIVLTDAFNPAPTNITVRINGDVIAPEEYSYVGGVLTLPDESGDLLSLPAATTTQDPVTGEITVVPSTMTITVTGTL